MNSAADIVWRKTARPEGGFTLLELLVAMTLLALLMAMLAGGIRIGNRAWQASETWADSSDRMSVVEDFLRAALSQTQPVVLRAGLEKRVVVFAGTPTSLDFVAPLPGSLAAAGRSLITLSAGSAVGGERLSARWRPYDTAEPAAAGTTAPAPTVLVDRAGAVDFAYFGALGTETPQWHDTWRGADHLPYLVRIRFRSVGPARRNWPDLVVALRMVPPPLGG